MSSAVTASPATCYTVNNGWAWARIFVRHGVRQDTSGPCSWADVSVISDYGSFGFCWSHIGAGPWQTFLAGLNFDYAMKKMMGPAFAEHLSVDECVEKARALIIDARRNGVTKSDARDMWDALDQIGEGYPPAAFLSEWDRASNGAMYRNEMYDGNWTKPSPSAVGFWAEIWPHFIAAISGQEVTASADGALEASSTLGTGGPIPSTPPFIQWNGGENPAPGKVVEVKLRNGNVFLSLADHLRWDCIDRPGDIIAYRIQFIYRA